MPAREAAGTLPACCRQCGGLCTEGIDFLAGLPREKQQALVRHAVHEVHARGSTLFAAEDRIEAIYIIRSGKVKLCTVDRSGREQIIGIYAERDTVWEGVFTGQGRYLYAGVCLTDVHCCKLLRRDLETVMQDPAVAMKVIGLLSRKLRDADERNLLLTIRDSKARLAGFLLQRSRRSASNVITLRLGDIAASINLRPETISRKLRELERDGLVAKVAQSSIRILDMSGLKDF